MSWEQWIPEQEELGAAIEKIFVNYKKEPKARKNAERLHKIKSELELSWNTFQMNNEAILSSEESKTSKYYQENYFDKIKIIYVECNGLIDKDSKKKIEESDDATVLKIKQMEAQEKHKQEWNTYYRITKSTLEQIKNIEENLIEEKADYFLKRLEKLYNELTNFHYIITE